jgi:hypothetical protein
MRSYARFIVKYDNDNFPQVVNYHITSDNFGTQYLKDMENNIYEEINIGHYSEAFDGQEIILWAIKNKVTEKIECYCVQYYFDREYFYKFGSKWNGTGQMFVNYDEARSEFLRARNKHWNEVDRKLS